MDVKMTFRRGNAWARVMGAGLAACGPVMVWAGCLALGEQAFVGAVIILSGLGICAAGLYLMFRISVVEFDLAARNWYWRTGLLFRPRIEKGAFADLRHVLVERFETGGRSEQQRTLYEVDVCAKKKRIQLFIGTESSPEMALDLAARVAGKLGLPIVKKLDEDD